MRAELFHIYGPFSIQSYGLVMVVALLIFSYLIGKDLRFKTLNLAPHYNQILLFCIVIGWIGGRVLFLLTHLEQIQTVGEIFAYWNGGFSIMGGVIALMIALPWYLKKLRIPVIPCLDLVGIYAPLLQGISRLGCFFAGCCYGAACQLPWGVTYTDSHSFAPLFQSLHPTQLYSAFILVGIFVIMYGFVQKYVHTPGYLALIYLILISSERFIVDFWRADRVFCSISFASFLSINQEIALMIIFGAIIAFLWLRQYYSSYNSSIRL